MSKFESLTIRPPRAAFLAGGTAIFLVLAGYASNESNCKAIENPAQRFTFDYVSGHRLVTNKPNSGETCLANTVYGSSHTAITPIGADGIKVTPSSIDNQSLEFTGLHDNSAPLQPSDEFTAAFLAKNDCHTAADAIYSGTDV